MPPLGVGANLAMLEGAELAEAVAFAATPGDLDEAVRLLRGTDVGTGRKVGGDHDGRSGTPREPGSLRGPRPLRRSPAVLTAERERGATPFTAVPRHRVVRVSDAKLLPAPTCGGPARGVFEIRRKKSRRDVENPRTAPSPR
ncbi:hypothetical protein GCM10018952_19670 [Streptosporangium vulgare]